jgi:drug/metabolite transporter (DMT)-like permease
MVMVQKSSDANSKDSMSSRNAQAITLIAAFFWGTSFVVIEIGLEIINPYWFAQLRFFVASGGALLVVLILNKRIEKGLLFSRWIWLLGLFNALGFIFQFVGMTMTTATKTALLVNLNLITVAVLSSILFSEGFSNKKSLAVILSIGGVFLLTTNGDPSRLATGEFRGDMLALCAGFVWAFYIVTNKKVISNPKIDIIPLTASVMMATTVIMLPFTLYLGGMSLERLDIGLSGLGFVLYIGIFCNIIPFILWTYGLRRLMPTTSTVILLFEICVAAILAMIILGEFLTIIGLLGGGLIVLGIIFIGLEAKNKNKRKSNIALK